MSQLMSGVLESEHVSRANLIVDYYDQVNDAIRRVVDDLSAITEPASFAPAFALPKLDDAMRRFFDVASVAWYDLGEYCGRRLSLLDLSGNPGTHTTKTYPSLLIVARAVEHIRQTGEPVAILSPTSGNKGTALRDAVLRAIDLGLVTPQQLRVIVLAPGTSAPKLRDSRLAADLELHKLNPVFVHEGQIADEVKTIGREFVVQHARTIKERLGINIWYSLDLRNYLVADTARAFFENDAAPIQSGSQRVHAHAVSSAFGLLGYHLGRSLLEEDGLAELSSRPSSLLIQHLGTPDMVLSLKYGTFDRGRMPSYTYDKSIGMYTQDADPHFPRLSDAPSEVLDSTFYTRRPVTSQQMNELISEHGGDGIVVSLAECVQRYPLIRELISASDRPLPADMSDLRERSLVMAFTGVLEAIDRGIVPPGVEVAVHGSGWYARQEFQSLPEQSFRRFVSVEELTSAFNI